MGKGMDEIAKLKAENERLRQLTRRMAAMLDVPAGADLEDWPTDEEITTVVNQAQHLSETSWDFLSPA